MAKEDTKGRKEQEYGIRLLYIVYHTRVSACFASNGNSETA